MFPCMCERLEEREEGSGKNGRKGQRREQEERGGGRELHRKELNGTCCASPLVSDWLWP